MIFPFNLRLFFFLLFIPVSLFSQGNKTKVLITFKDKNTSSFDPYTYFDSLAVARRVSQHLPIYDYTDLPVKDEYVNSVLKICDSVKVITRWLNGVVCYATPEDIEQVINLAFVSDIEFLNSSGALASVYHQETSPDISQEDMKLLLHQTERMGADDFQKAGIKGEGIRIAIFDAGFPGVNTHPAFEHIRKYNRIIKTYDFVRKKDFVFAYNSHGTMVMSCIGGIANGRIMGMATEAEFLLARTENAKFEPFSEEENWLAAVEWADKNGAQIINSSLGYTHHRYFNNQMDGKTSLVSRAANLAASKGMLVVNAAGNDGSGKWHFIGTPADADSVLSVGGIHPSTNIHTTFSSFGPSSDKRLKPNVVSLGHVIAADKTGYTNTQGTSFSSPLVAGFAACAWQTNKSLTNMGLFLEIEKSGDLYPYFDYAHGYGVPQASYFVKTDTSSVEPTFDILVDKEETIHIVIKEQFMPDTTKPESVPKNPIGIKNISNASHFFYRIENEDGSIEKYLVLEVAYQNILDIYLHERKKGQTLKIHYKNFTSTFKY